MPISIPKWKFLLLLWDILCITVSFYLTPLLRFGVVPDVDVLLVPELVLFTLYLASFYVFELYSIDVTTGRFTTFSRIVIANAAAFFLAAALFYIFNVRPYDTVTLTIWASMVFVLCLLSRLIITGTKKTSIFAPKRVLIIGKDKHSLELAEEIKKRKDFHFLGFLDELTDKKDNTPPTGKGNTENSDTYHLKRTPAKLKPDAIIISPFIEKSPQFTRELTQIKLSGVDILEPSIFSEINFQRIPVRYIDDRWFVFSRITGVRRTLYNRRFKKLLDKAIASILLLASLPFVAIITAAIKLESPGPVLFRQRRVGFQGKPFVLYKFRSMKVGQEYQRELAGQPDDPRITRVGKFLRLFRIDELPQLINVIKGEMSLIGPRALMEEEVQTFSEKIPYFNLRHTVRPGITGWAQVNYRHGVTLEDALIKLEYDLYYIKNLSFLLDLHVIARTIRVVIFARGAR
ncbi:MAG: sugar transferase [Syntrophales bacterium]|nr:sugar transferase [Syntrophales bacterium]